jgi:prepilin-type N-terminal cleavage/methylation domain-containing protein
VNTTRILGFSLIEILIGLTIISLMVMLAVPSVNRIFQTDLRSSVRQLSIITRAIYNESILKKRLFRLVIDLDENKYWAEMSPSNSLVYLRDEDLENEDDKTFHTFQDGFAKYSDQFIREKELPSGVIFQDVNNAVLYTQPVTGGHAYIFFYPRGEVDPSLIHIAHERPGGVIYTIEIMPVSGNTRFYFGYTGVGGEAIVQ